MAKFETGDTVACTMGEFYEFMVGEQTTTAKYEALGNHEVSVQVSPEGDGDRIDVSRVVDLDVPGFLKKVVSPNNTYEQVDRWTPVGDGHDGVFTIDVKGAPIKLWGTMTLRPAGSGVEYRIMGEAKVSIPLIGGKAADYVVGQAKQIAGQEVAFCKRSLES